jgi:hypothetical protein
LVDDVNSGGARLVARLITGGLLLVMRVTMTDVEMVGLDRAFLPGWNERGRAREVVIGPAPAQEPWRFGGRFVHVRLHPEAVIELWAERCRWRKLVRCDVLWDMVRWLPEDRHLVAGVKGWQWPAGVAGCYDLATATRVVDGMYGGRVPCVGGEVV